MIGEYKFFQDFFDGQIVKKESENFKLFKLVLFSSLSALGLFLVLMNICNVAEFLLLECGMIWNFYLGLGNKFSMLFCFIVSLLYFFFCSNFGLYANGLVYLGCYIPIQLIATTKDYEEGDFVQIKKAMNDYNKILFIMFFLLLAVALTLIDVSVGSRFSIIDGVVGAFLICSAVLRNERYVEYYIFRVFALVSSLVLWTMIMLEFGTVGTISIILMYLSYLVYDVVNFVYQKKTYLNQYMVQVASYKKQEDNALVEEKLKIYKNMKVFDEKNK
jgi:nicotinamide riboside transporter PnuC